MSTDRDAIAHGMTLALRRVVRQLQLHSRTMAREAGLTLPQYLTMRALRDRTELLTLSQLAKAVQLSPSTMSTLVERLVGAGLVTRERSQVDRRKVGMALTEEGRKRLTVPSPLQDRFIERLDRVPAARREELLGALEEVVQLLGAEDLQPSPLEH